jgi:hypothetical protein
MVLLSMLCLCCTYVSCSLEKQFSRGTLLIADVDEDQASVTASIQTRRITCPAVRPDNDKSWVLSLMSWAPAIGPHRALIVPRRRGSWGGFFGPGGLKSCRRSSRLSRPRKAPDDERPYVIGPSVVAWRSCYLHCIVCTYVQFHSIAFPYIQNVL